MALFAIGAAALTPMKETSVSATKLIALVRKSPVDVVGHRLLPVAWEGPDFLLTADSNACAVLVNVRERLSATDLFQTVTKLGRYSHMGRAELAARYPGGSFDQDWSALFEGVPSGVKSPRLVIVMVEADPDVYPVVATLSDRVEVIKAAAYLSGGQTLVSFEPLRKDSAPQATLPTTPQPAISGAPEVRSNEKPAGAAQPRVGRRSRRVPEVKPVVASAAGAGDFGSAVGGAGGTGSEVREKAIGSASSEKTFGSAARLPFEPAKILPNEEETKETPAYATIRQVQEVRRMRTEQLLWERSAPHKGGEEARLISESQAAKASSQAVTRAAERDHLTPLARLQAIAGRHGSVILTLSAKRAVRAKLTAWGTIIYNSRSFSDPNAAAEAALDGERVDGWRAWRALDGRSLEEL